MTDSYSLENLKADLDRQFAPLALEAGGQKLVLQNLLRLGEKDRAAVMAALAEVEDSGDSVDGSGSVADLDRLSAAVTTVLRTVTADGKGDKLIASLAGDVMLAMKVIELWAEATQPGEAQNSPA